MPGFSIEFTEELFTDKETDNFSQFGVITLDNFQERFLSPLSFWFKQDYQNQWKEALQRIKNGMNSSCLVTSMLNPKTANFFAWWPLYREQDIVYVQNHLFFLDTLKEVFDINNLYNYVRERETTTDEGEKISEWCVPVVAIEAFLQKLETDK